MLARDLRVPPSILRGRIRPMTYVYDDPEHPDRPTGMVQTPEWTSEDRSLLLGLVAYERTLCPGCHNPKQTAWHQGMADSWAKTAEVVCHACTAEQGQQVVYVVVGHEEPPAYLAGLPALVLGENTDAPDHDSST